MSNLWEPVAGVYWSAVPLMSNLDLTRGFSGASFITTLVGALSGAFFGAWAAQRIAKSNKVQDDIIKEIRSVNAAIMLGQFIFNCAVATKKQCSEPLKKNL